MDVHCTTCGEPWDVDHLWHDAIFDTTLSPEEAETWSRLPRAEKLSPRYRERFQSAGWTFGRTVLNVIHCPGCGNDAKPNPELLEAKSELEAMLEDDPDGLAATFEDFEF
jgi:hypothetical protein